MGHWMYKNRITTLEEDFSFLNLDKDKVYKISNIVNEDENVNNVRDKYSLFRNRRRFISEGIKAPIFRSRRFISEDIKAPVFRSIKYKD